MLDIPKLQRNIPIVQDVYPSEEFHIWWQNVAKSLIDTINSQSQQIIAIQNALDTANQAKKTTARVNSYTVPTNVVTATDGGTSATITVADHLRIYPDDAILNIPDVSVTGAALTGLTYSSKYYVYYDDSTLTVTTPTFIATLNPTLAQVGAGPGRHFVGVVTTPASGGGSVGGGGGTPPGGGGGVLP